MRRQAFVAGIGFLVLFVAFPAPAERTAIEGNLVWQALKRKGAAGWFTAGDDTLLEAMMSLTGSVIVGEPEPAPDGQGENHRITYLPGNLLKVADVLNGTREREDAAQRANAWAQRVHMYQCGPVGGPIDPTHIPPFNWLCLR